MSTRSMAAAPVFILITVVLFAVGACLYSLKQHKTKQMRAQAEQMDALAQQQAMEQKAHLDAAGNHLALAVQGTQDGLWYWDLKAKTFRFSSGWETLLGFAKGELSQNPNEWFSRVHPAYRAELDARITAHLLGETEQFRYEHRMRRNDGSYFWVSARATANRNESGEALGLAGSHSDITSLIPVERELLDDAFHDKLTGLPNRHFFMGRLDTAVEERRQEGRRNRLFAVMFLDLDRFKHINDTLGHQVGDQLLAGVARRLQKCVGPSDMVARLGGDEFVILLDCVRDAEEALSVGARISDAFATAFEIDGSEVMTGASIGIALSRERFDATEDLVALADLAMYHSKTQRKGRPELFHERMKEQPAKFASRQGELARALKKQEFLLDYQPYFDMHSGRILGVEALIRWQSQNLVLSPSDFIPLAEETGLIHDIGEWVLRTACAQSSAWQRAGIPPIQMAVNVSAKQLHETDFAQRVVAVLDETGLAPRWLNLELTESALMDTYEKAPATLERLDTLGIGTSIDDFGTGYSSLNYLRRFNFQTLKMDRCFVSEIATNKKAAVIVKGLISIAHNLGISVIAEGVERHDQLRLLAAENCDHVQGFLTGRPVAPEQILKLLRSVNVNEQNLRVAGGLRSLLDDCSEAIPADQLGAMAEACRNWIEPGVKSNDDSLVTLVER